MSSATPYSGRQQKVGNAVIKVMSRANTWLYRRTGGRVGGRFLRGAPVCLVTTTGKKTGLPRTVPLLYLADGDNVVIVASKGGFPEHPQWFHNLVAHPEVTVEVGHHTRHMVARVADPAEKAELWPRLVAMYRDYDSYQARTARDIPVVICSPS